MSRANGIDAQHPSLAGCEIHEREVGRRRTDKLSRRADRLEIGQRSTIAREQQVIAVVDHHVEYRVMIGSTAASGSAGGLVHNDPCPKGRKPHRGGEPGESRADDVDGARHQMKAWRMMIHSSRARGRWMGRRGCDQPRATRLSRISR